MSTVLKPISKTNFTATRFCAY